MVESDSQGFNPLMNAIRSGNAKTVSLFLRQPKLKEQLEHKEWRGGLNALMAACVRGNPDIIKLLLGAGKGSFTVSQIRFIDP